jgi:hypothetical protein
MIYFILTKYFLIPESFPYKSLENTINQKCLVKNNTKGSWVISPITFYAFYTLYSIPLYPYLILALAVGLWLLANSVKTIAALYPYFPVSISPHFLPFTEYLIQKG